MKKPVLPPLLLDDRIGSKELILPLQQKGVPVELTRLRFGDAAIVGNGPAGLTMIGVERKRIRDLLASLMTGRLAGHQLPGLVEEYAHRWIVVEGVYRTNTLGHVEIPKGGGKWESLRFEGIALDKYLLTLELRGGCGTKRTYNSDETAQFLAAVHSWWSDPWASHRGHLALHTPPDAMCLVRPSLVRRWAAELPGIGFEKSGAVAERFKTPLALALATEDELRRVDGIGKKIAANAIQAIQGEER
jgi:ERCC4-type nuclease